MAYSREQIEKSWVPDDGIRHHGLTRGKKYLGRDVPEEYFVVQDWCLAQGVAPLGSDTPDLTQVLQGVEYVIQAATGKYPDEKILSSQEINGMMPYLNRETEFNGGALRQFPELQKLLKEQLSKLPKGSIVIATIRALPQYQDIFN